MFKKFFEKKKAGVIAVEWIILAPLMLFIIFISIMMLIFVMDRTIYTNACSDLAQELNLGDTGYKAYAGSPIGLTTTEYQNDMMGSLGLSRAVGTKNVQVYCTNTSDGYFERAFYYHLNKFLSLGRFNCPYSTLHSIECRVYDGNGEDNGFNTDPLKTESGNMIEVKVKYRFLIFEVTDYGYSFII